MKNISAVICELNPFHKGHKYVFDTAREKGSLLIAIMSGNFVQRGECAVYHKYTRAESALEGGADLVVELPFPYSAASAEFFAAAGVEIAERIGATDIYFGSECADLEALKTAGDALAKRRDFIPGRAAEQREEILRQIEDLPESILCSPNDILGVEYVRNTSLNAHPVKRISTDSATALRSEIYKNGNDFASLEKLQEIEFYHYRTAGSNTETAESGGGVGERLYNAAFKTNDPAKFWTSAYTKQYTNSRIRRTALFEICKVSHYLMRSKLGYTRLLGASKAGREYLSSIRKGCDFPIITNQREKSMLSGYALEQFEAGERADKIYTLVTNIEDPAFFATHGPIIVEK